MSLQQEVAEKLKSKGSIAWHADQLSPSLKNDLPAEWLQAIGTENLPAALELIWKPWLPFTQQQPEAFGLLQKTVHGLAIYTDNTGVSSLLYIFRFKSGRLSLMAGYLPQKKCLIISIGGRWLLHLYVLFMNRCIMDGSL